MIALTNDPPILEANPYRANLYPLHLTSLPSELYVVAIDSGGRTREEIRFDAVDGASRIAPEPYAMRRALQQTVLSALDEAEYGVTEGFPIIVDKTPIYAPEGKRVKIFASYRVRVMSFGDSYYLCLNHRLLVRLPVRLANLAKLDTKFRLNPAQRVQVQSSSGWQSARLVSQDAELCQLVLAEGGEFEASVTNVVPMLTHAQIVSLANL